TLKRVSLVERCAEVSDVACQDCSEVPSLTSESRCPCRQLLDERARRPRRPRRQPGKTIESLRCTRQRRQSREVMPGDSKATLEVSIHASLRQSSELAQIVARTSDRTL